MSSRYNPVRTNKTPWTDKLTLISQTETVDNEGYETVVETTRNIYCTFSNGINRNEFYESMKAGVKLSASVECWAKDYKDETLCECHNVRYKIIRSYETGRGTVELSLSEVTR